MRTRLLLLLAALAGGHASLALPAADPPSFPVERAVVVLDVVARDGRGRMVRELLLSDFEVYEDGVLQQLESFQVVSRAASSAGPNPSADGPLPPEHAQAAAAGPATEAEGAVVALVFDRLSPVARAFAWRSALSYLDLVHRRHDLVAVFALDLSLRPVTSFTSDASRLRAAIQDAVRFGQGAGVAEDDRAELRRRTEQLGLIEQHLERLMPSAASAAQTIGDFKARAAAEQRAIDIERTSQAYERERRGRAAADGLLAVVHILGAVRGRKTLVLFSEGLPASGASRESQLSLIDAANRANVSVYAIDPAGMRAVSSVSEAREDLARAVQLRSRLLLSGGDDAPEHALLRQHERNEDALRVGAEATLGPLARETGGLLITETNDFSRHLRELAEDMRFHYLLSFTPSRTDSAGRFRKLAVKVRRPGVRIRTRRGYLAARTP